MTIKKQNIYFIRSYYSFIKLTTAYSCFAINYILCPYISCRYWKVLEHAPLLALDKGENRLNLLISLLYFNIHVNTIFVCCYIIVFNTGKCVLNSGTFSYLDLHYVKKSCFFLTNLYQFVKILNQTFLEKLLNTISL